jgi:hypothetical protein
MSPRLAGRINGSNAPAVSCVPVTSTPAVRHIDDLSGADHADLRDLRSPGFIGSDLDVAIEIVVELVGESRPKVGDS